MSPINVFLAVWGRCDTLRVLYTYMHANLTDVLRPDELLRAEWVARVSALDLYVHELIAQRLLEVLQGVRPQVTGIQKFEIGAETLFRVRSASNQIEAAGAFDLEVRTKLSRLTFQHPDKIADGIRLVCEKELWNEIALVSGAIPIQKNNKAKAMRKQLAAIIERRHLIAHEGDLSTTIPRVARPISVADLDTVTDFISKLVKQIDVLVS